MPAPVACRSAVSISELFCWLLAREGLCGPAMHEIGRILGAAHWSQQTEVQEDGFGLLEAQRDAERRLGELGQVLPELTQLDSGEPQCLQPGWASFSQCYLLGFVQTGKAGVPVEIGWQWLFVTHLPAQAHIIDG